MPAEFQLRSPFPDHALPRIWAWTEEFRHQVTDDFGPKSLPEFMADWEMKQGLRLSWAIEHDGEIGGVVCVDRVSPVLGYAQAITKRAFWGHDKLLAPMREAYTHAFETGLQKLYSLVFPDNANVIHLARLLGFAREGRLKHHTARGGVPVDMLILGLTQADFARAVPQEAAG